VAVNGVPAFPRRWSVLPADDARARGLAGDLEIPFLLGRLLVQRGITGAGEARDFLEAPLTGLHDPFEMKGMAEAAAHLAGEAAAGRPVGVYGDFDVDGVSSTALLLHFFSALGVPVHFHIPHRMREGYGLHPPGLERLAAAGCRTVVTVDCGIASHEAARRAKEMGLPLIITDHHRPPERLPEALAVLNPRQPGCGYPFRGLSGVGIAFKLATAVRRRLHEGGFAGELPNLRQHLDLVALGTVADVVPLLGENHILVRRGLEALSPPAGGAGPDRRKEGVRALQAAADLKAEAVNAGHVGFVLAPRLNAAGRVGEADLAVALLTERDPGRARAAAEVLEEWNRQRQELQEEAWAEAEAMLAAEAAAGARAIVLASERWHPGVIGIVASKLVEQHGRPAALIRLDGERGKGSVRGVEGFHVFEALGACADLLLQFGGHRGAAGLSILRGRVDAFRERFGEVARERLGEEVPERELRLDAVVDFEELRLPLLKRLEDLAPFGAGNPRPVFAASGVEVAGAPSYVGRDGGHLKLRLRQRAEVCEAIGFGLGGIRADPSLLQGKLDVAFCAGVNRWRGQESVQLELRAVRPAGG